MKRVKDVVRIAVACGLALPALLVGCTRSEAPSAAVAQPAIETPMAASDSLPEVVISAPREGAKPIVLTDSSAKSGADR